LSAAVARHSDEQEKSRTNAKVKLGIGFIKFIEMRVGKGFYNISVYCKANTGADIYWFYISGWLDNLFASNKKALKNWLNKGLFTI